MGILAGIVPIRAALGMVSSALRPRPGGAGDGFAAILEQSVGSRMVSHLDVDGSKTLNASESGLNAEMFGRLDADGDGALTIGEINRGIAQMRFEAKLQRAADETIEFSDSNDDGVLSVDELGAERGVFERVDVNADAVVDRTELLRALRNRAGAA